MLMLMGAAMISWLALAGGSALLSLCPKRTNYRSVSACSLLHAHILCHKSRLISAYSHSGPTSQSFISYKITSALDDITTTGPKASKVPALSPARAWESRIAAGT